MPNIDENQTWVNQCNALIRKVQERRSRLRCVAIVCALNELEAQSKKPLRKKKRFWVHPILQLRKDHGFYEAIFPTLSLHEDKFKNYFRMSTEQFENLLSLVGPLIVKQKAIRDPISAPARLAMTLRLAV